MADQMLPSLLAFGSAMAEAAGAAMAFSGILLFEVFRGSGTGVTRGSGRAGSALLCSVLRCSVLRCSVLRCSDFFSCFDCALAGAAFAVSDGFASRPMTFGAGGCSSVAEGFAGFDSMEPAAGAGSLDVF